MAKRQREENDDGKVDTDLEYKVVFVDTSIDTRFAMLVSRSDTVSRFKKTIELEHVSLFPEIGNIHIHSLKIKRGEIFYHLPDLMLVWSVFFGQEGTWFLSADASKTSTCLLSQMACNLAEKDDVESDENNTDDNGENLPLDVKRNPDLSSLPAADLEKNIVACVSASMEDDPAETRKNKKECPQQSSVVTRKNDIAAETRLEVEKSSIDTAVCPSSNLSLENSPRSESRHRKKRKIDANQNTDWENSTCLLLPESVKDPSIPDIVESTDAKIDAANEVLGGLGSNANAIMKPEIYAGLKKKSKKKGKNYVDANMEKSGMECADKPSFEPSSASAQQENSVLCREGIDFQENLDSAVLANEKTQNANGYVADSMPSSQTLQDKDAITRKIGSSVIEEITDENPEIAIFEREFNELKVASKSKHEKPRKNKKKSKSTVPGLEDILPDNATKVDNKALPSKENMIQEDIDSAVHANKKTLDTIEGEADFMRLSQKLQAGENPEVSSLEREGKVKEISELKANFECQKEMPRKKKKKSKSTLAAQEDKFQDKHQVDPKVFSNNENMIQGDAARSLHLPQKSNDPVEENQGTPRSASNPVNIQNHVDGHYVS